MEAAPRLPMLSIELRNSTDGTSFGAKLKQFISQFYHEDAESFSNEIHSLETLRATSIRPAIDVNGCQALKQYYCQLNFLKSRFPMLKDSSCSISYTWKDVYSGVLHTSTDLNFELSNILYNIGALHTQLGAADTRSSSDGMRMSCTHFQCAAWAFQHLVENFTPMITSLTLPELITMMHRLCLAQAQECILEKSMLDNRKSTIIAKVAVQVVDYYNQALSILTNQVDHNTLTDMIGSRLLKEWTRYLKFKIAYHNCISFLYQGQQAEEAQKMGERVAYYQAASEYLEEARKIAKGNMGRQQHEIDEALAFTQDVVEGKKKAAKNENEFIYHEVVPEKDALQQVNGASLVKGTPFNINDPDVSGKDLFHRLVPLEAHESSSIYSEQKAEMLRQIGAIVDVKNSELVEYMSSLQLDYLNQWRNAVGIPQDIVDRAAALCAKPQSIQALIEVMNRLSGSFQEVESLLHEIQEMIKEEEVKEQEYQKIMGNRPPGIISTDLSREATKYVEAHTKATESNQTLHRAMTMHMSNLKILGQPLSELKKAIPSAGSEDSSIDESFLTELETLLAKVDEMRNQRATLFAQLREAICNDDITALLVVKPSDMTQEQLFQKELGKHNRQAALIEQNLAAQDNILAALTDTYAKFAPTRRHILEMLKRREATISALINSYDAYDDLLTKANKGIEFYQKLEGNISKLHQRIKSACRVNQEERDQMLSKVKRDSTTSTPNPVAPKLKDYLAGMRSSSTSDATSQWVPPIRPTPLGQEETKDTKLSFDSSAPQTQYQNLTEVYNPSDPNMYLSYSQNYQYRTPTYPDPTKSDPSHYYPTASAFSQYYTTQSNYASYQYPSVYASGNSYTPASTPQQNFSTPGIYSPSTDTSAPSQKFEQAAPSITSGYSSNYTTENNYSPQPVKQSVVISHNSAVYQQIPNSSSNYSLAFQNISNTSSAYSAHSYQQDTYQTYQPANIDPAISYSQAPNEEYQKQYQYIPQFYSSYSPSQLEISEAFATPTAVYPIQEQYYTLPYGYQKEGNSSGTMMQANNATTSTKNSSNVDLLSGLDFSVGVAPLQPQVNIPKPNPKQTSSNVPIKQEPPKKEEKKNTEKAKEPEVHVHIEENPLHDPNTFYNFCLDVEKFEKFVDGLTTKTLNGPTALDLKWKEIQEQQDRESQKYIISVARCYPMKNRLPDILPYDHSRVELPSTKDDYINASHIRGITFNSPPFIVTQAPLKATFDDLWTMVWEQQIEVIVCMLGEAESVQEGAVYWPTERGSELQIGKFRLNLQSVNHHEHWIERIISLGIGTKQIVVIHLQFTSWPSGGLFPTSLTSVIQFAEAILTCFQQQRIKNRPVLVHCLSGVGRSGVICLLMAAICDPIQTIDVIKVASTMCRFRKNILRDREHLKFAYQLILKHFKDLLNIKQLRDKIKEIMITEKRNSDFNKPLNVPTSEEQPKKSIPETASVDQASTSKVTSTDPLNDLDIFWTIHKDSTKK